MAAPVDAHDSVRRLVVARRAAGLAIHEPIGAEPNVQLRLAQNAELLAIAAGFNLLALATADLGTRLGRHTPNSNVGRMVVERHGSNDERCQEAGVRA